MRDAIDDTGSVIARAGLRRRRILAAFFSVAAIAGAGALVTALFLKSARDAAVARAATAEASAARLLESNRSLEAEREELRGRVERLERENAELLALKTQLSSDVAARDEELARLSAARAELEQKMKAEIDSGDVLLTDDRGRLRVDFVDKILFDSGEAAISARGRDVLTRVAAVLGGIDGKLIQVSGHTDDSPPTGKIADRFPTNWELSTARATNVVRFLQDEAGIPGKRLVATGFGQFQPVATNVNGKGRARNRRIEILLVPALEPVPARRAGAR